MGSTTSLPAGKSGGIVESVLVVYGTVSPAGVVRSIVEDLTVGELVLFLVSVAGGPDSIDQLGGPVTAALPALGQRASAAPPQVWWRIQEIEPDQGTPIGAAASNAHAPP